MAIHVLLEYLNHEFIPLCHGEEKRNVVIISNNCSYESIDETITIISKYILLTTVLVNGDKTNKQ